MAGCWPIWIGGAAALGYGLHGDDPLSFFLIDEHLAYGNPSTARCFQVHNNALMMIDAMAGDEQVQRWLEPTIKHGALIPGAGAEPHGSPPTTARGPPLSVFQNL